MYSYNDFERLFLRYKLECLPSGVSIENFCISNKVPYNPFVKWYKDTRKKIIPVQVLGAPDTNWVVPLGPNVNAFEDELKHFVGQDKEVVALSAGTAAIHLGVIQLGVGAGDEVICQSFTFCASANPVAYQGAKPVFVDSEEDTWNMDPVLLEEAIKDRILKTGKKPKAILPVHLYGMPARIDEICAIAAIYDIPVLEDAAEALGSEFNGRK